MPSEIAQKDLAAPQRHEPEAGETRLAPAVVLLLGCLVALGPLAIDMYLPAFAHIAEDLEVNLGSVQLTLSIFLAGTAFGQAAFGPLTDRMGRRQPLLWGVAIYLVAAVACALADSIGALLVARVAMAVGAASGMVIARAVVRDCCGLVQMARTMSVLMLIMGAGPVLAPSIGGLLLPVAGWRGIFWALAGFGALSLIAAWRMLPETLPTERRSETVARAAMANYRYLLSDRWFQVHALMAGAVSAGLFAYVAGAPAVFMEEHGMGPRAFSILFGLNAAVLIGFAQVNRLGLRWKTPRQLLLLASRVQAVAAFGLWLLALTGARNLVVIELAVGASLAGMGMMMPNIGALVLAPFGRMAGSASALQGCLQFGCGAIAGSLLSLLPVSGLLPVASILAVTALLAATLAHVSGRLNVHREPKPAPRLTPQYQGTGAPGNVLR